MMRGVELSGADIQGEIENLTINGVDIGPLVNAELNRRYPDRAKMRPADPAGFGEAWDILERLWGQTVERARRLPPELLHETVGGEWSFIETLRHLVFASDAWIRRAILGDPSPWHPLDLPWDEMPDTPGVPRDRHARPSLEAVLDLRRDRMSTVRQVIEGLTRTPGWTATPNWSRGPAGHSPAATRCVNACCASSSKSGSTGCTPSGTWMPWRHAARSGGAGDLLRTQPLPASPRRFVRARCLGTVTARPLLPRMRYVSEQPHPARIRLRGPQADPPARRRRSASSLMSLLPRGSRRQASAPAWNTRWNTRSRVRWGHQQVSHPLQLRQYSASS